MMVEAGVAEELAEEIQYGNWVPSKFWLTNPVAFLDETSSNTNQIKDGRVGGERYILPMQQSEQGAPIGATADCHFTV